MSFCNWEDEDWDTLIYEIGQKKCILMLGPDTATETVNGQPRLLTESLADQLANKIDPETLKRINTSDLAQVAQYYAMDKGPNRLEVRVSSFYNEKKELCSDFHRNLAALPFYFTITTTPDTMFIKALKQENKEPVLDWYNFNGENREMVQMGTVEKPLVFYLYGSVEEPGSLLLTEKDLLDFLVVLISGKRKLPENIRSELRDEDKSFLFLGFGFRHWYLRILMHVLQGGNKKENPSLAIETGRFPPESIAELQRNVFFFEKSDYKIHIFEGDFISFAEELKKKFEGSSPAVTSGVKAGKGPEVFICHASEDKDYAAVLSKKLKKEGIRPWLDKENLRGGEEWDSKIMDTIKKVDFFVVLQSNALVKKSIGYVNREINCALDRLPEFQRGKHIFIIPVQIEACQLRGDLDHLQTTDLTDETNIKKIASLIKRDFEKRNNQ